MSPETTMEDIDYAVDSLKSAVGTMRSLSPLYDDFVKKESARMYDGEYSDKVIDHFTNPRNVGEIEDASGVGTVGNAKCGDIMRIYLDIDEDGIIRDCKFKTFGCGAAVASSSMATEMVKGKSVQEAMAITNKAVMEALDGLPTVKIHCSLLAEEAIHAALWDYAQKNGIEIEGLEAPKKDINDRADRGSGASLLSPRALRPELLQTDLDKKKEEGPEPPVEFQIRSSNPSTTLGNFSLTALRRLYTVTCSRFAVFTSLMSSSMVSSSRVASFSLAMKFLNSLSSILSRHIFS
jgi:nitrogen fixation NifU-like protein